MKNQNELKPDQLAIAELYRDALLPQGAAGASIEDAANIALLSEFVRRLTAALSEAGRHEDQIVSLITAEPELGPVEEVRKMGVEAMQWLSRQAGMPLEADPAPLWDAMTTWEQWRTLALYRALLYRATVGTTTSPHASTMAQVLNMAGDAGMVRQQLSRALVQAEEGQTVAAARLIERALHGASVSPQTRAFIEGALEESRNMGRPEKIQEWLLLADASLRNEAAAAVSHRIADENGGAA